MKKTILILITLVFNFNFSNAQWIQTNGPYCPGLSHLVVCGSNIITGRTSLFFSGNGGMNWTPINNALNSTIIAGLCANGNDIFVGIDTGLFISSNNGSLWTQINRNMVNSAFSILTISDSNIYAGIGRGDSAGICISRNYGRNWTSLNNGLPDNTVRAIAKKDSLLFIATNKTLYLSVNDGVSWAPANNGIPDNQIPSILIDGNNIFAGTYGHGDGIYRSNNNGSTWTPVNNGLPFNPSIHTLIKSGSTLIVGANSFGVFISSDNGDSWRGWNDGGLGTETINALAATGTDIYACTVSGYVWKRSLTEITALDEIEKNGFTIYPNPAFNELNIEMEKISLSDKTNIFIYDIMGKLVSSQDLAQGNAKVDISNLDKGVYILKINMSNKSEKIKIVKK